MVLICELMHTQLFHCGQAFATVILGRTDVGRLCMDAVPPVYQHNITSETSENYY